MMIRVAALLGIGPIPSHRSSASKWMRTNEIEIVIDDTDRRCPEYVALSDLPEAVRLAYLHRECEVWHLDPGEYDDEAHARYMAAKPKARERAERKAAIARVLIAARARGVKEGERFALVRRKFGGQGTSAPTLKRLSKAVQGVAPINYAPALLDDFKSTAQRKEFDDAWSLFMTLIRDAAPEWPLLSAWRDVRDIYEKQGQEVPSYSTFYKRWKALPEAQRIEAREGKSAVIDRLKLTVHRDKTSILPLEWVSLDGRMLDFWVDFGDGKPVRPVMLTVVDVASNKVLDWELAASENARSTVRIIKQVCERHGIFDRLYTDNGSAFAGHLVAGGAGFKFRNSATSQDALKPFGICKIMCIELRFALPKNAQAKIAERTFATLSRVVDDRPEFRGAHSGHAPGASPNSKVVPVPIERAREVYRREIERHNREGGRRSQGARGRSYAEVFEAGLTERTLRRPTARQLYLAGLVWKPVAVDRKGQMQVDGWVYGGPDTQHVLLRHHGNGRKVLIGRDPDDFSAPAIAHDADGKRICEGIEAVQRGAYGSVDGAREAARYRKDATRKAEAAREANNYLSDKELEAALAVLDQETPPPAPAKPKSKKVVAGHFDTPLRDRGTAPKVAESDEIPAEFYRNMDTALAAERSKRGKPA